MPLYFNIDSLEVEVTDLSTATTRVLEVANPFVNTYAEHESKVFPRERIACIDEGECLFLSSEEKRYQLSASLGTTSCVQIFLFNEKKESCLLHTNQYFLVPWDKIINAFTDHKLSMILVGASGKFKISASNIQFVFEGMLKFLNLHKTIQITLQRQLVLDHNPRQEIDFFSFFSHGSTSLKNTGFTATGELYDLNRIKDSTPNFPLAPQLRKARLEDAQHRGCIRLNYNHNEIPIPELLFISVNTTKSDITRETFFHKSFVDFADYILKTKQLASFSNNIAVISNGTEDVQGVLILKENSSAFRLAGAYNQSNEMKEIMEQLKKHPSGPFNSTIHSYKNNYTDISKQYIEHIAEDAATKKM